MVSSAFGEADHQTIIPKDRLIRFVVDGKTNDLSI
jgi:hypothetical protein